MFIYYHILVKFITILTVFKPDRNEPDWTQWCEFGRLLFLRLGMEPQPTTEEY